MLTFIPTPIGNKEDITLRALRLLKELKYLICEDTSFTDKGKLTHYANLIRENEVGMLSDAGTPGLSDPGKMLVQICQNE